MPAVITAVRAYQLTDAGGHPLPSPVLLDLDTDTIPYGARVRFEVDTTGEESLKPIRAWRQPEENGVLHLFPVGGGTTFAGEVRLPWGLMYGGGEVLGSSQPPCFPLAGVPPYGEGEYTLRLFVRRADETLLEERDVSFRVGAPPSSGGAPPSIVSVNTGLAGNQVRLGQPWLLTAQVTDPDDDVLVVIFSVLQGDLAQWWFMVDDGSQGDAVAGDGIYSFLRVGGDPWERPDLAGGADVTATLTVQAGDVRGNWSEPVTLNYQILTSQEPLWMEEPTPGAPDITDGGVNHAQGPSGRAKVWARSSVLDSWVCARLIGDPSQTFPLFDDGQGIDAAAGDGIFTAMPGIHLRREYDLVLYGVPKTGPVHLGEKLAVHWTQAE